MLPSGATPLADLPRSGLVAVIVAAHESGLIADLSSGLTVAATAARRRIDERAAGLVVDALCSLGLCTRRPDGSVDWPRRFDDGWPWTAVGEFLRKGEIGSVIDQTEARGPLYAQVVSALSDRAEPFASSVAAALPARRHVVDVGAGAGAWSLAMATASPGTRVTAIDLPEVLPRFFERAGRLGLADRVDGVAASYFEATVPNPIDRVLFANVLHLESPADCARLVGRFAEALDPGGDVVIVDCILDGTSEQAEVFRAFYALHLGMRTGRGGVHAIGDLRRWCEDAGLGDLRLVSPEPRVGLGVLVGVKPATRPGRTRA